MSATLDGNVDLNGLDPVNLVVRFFTPDTTTEVLRACAPTDGSGDFTILGIPPGTYDVGVKSDNSLSILVEDVEFTDEATEDVDFGLLKRGDINNDDWATSADRSILYLYWGQGGDCWEYPGDWLMPECPSPPPPGGSCWGYVTS